MHTRRHLLTLALLLVALAGCGGASTRTTTSSPTPGGARPTASASASTTPTSTATPGVTRLAYPWPMVRVPGNTPPWNYLPDQGTRTEVQEEQVSDLRAFWTWIGYFKPENVLHFQPDATQVSHYAAGGFAQTVQQQLSALQSSGHLITYSTTDFRLDLEGCKEDGLTCTALLALGLTRKIVYDTRSGAVLVEDPPAGQAANFGGAALTLKYVKEEQRWKVTALQLDYSA